MNKKRVAVVAYEDKRRALKAAESLSREVPPKPTLRAVPPIAEEESPTRTEWEVVVTDPPAQARGAILNMVPPGDAFTLGPRKIVLQGFYDDEEAAHVAKSIAKKYGCLVTFGPKLNEKTDRPAVAAEEPCGCGGKKREQTVQVISAPEALIAQESREVAEQDGSACKPFTRIERDPAKFQACMARAKDLGPIDNSKALYNLVAPDLIKNDVEVFDVVCIDMRGQLRDWVSISVGQRHRVAVDIEDILAAVILSKCDGFAVMHVHPSGHASPSDADKRLTKAIAKASACACPNVAFIDHVIVCPTEYYSFADRKLHRV